MSLEECNKWFSSYGFLVSASCGSSQSCSIVVLFRPVFSLLSTSCDTNGRFAACDFLYRDKRFRVISLYAPNTNPQRDDFFAYVASMADLSVPSILCGDFNAIFNRHLDRVSPSIIDPARDSSVPLRALFQEYCVVDAWRYCHPSSRAFTWHKPDGSISSRIDFIGVPLSWAPFVSYCHCVPCPFCDHSVVSVDVSVPDTIQRGPGRWKLNVSLLRDEDFVDEVEALWLSWRMHKGLYSSLQKWWDAGKEKIKGLAVRFSSYKKKVSLEARSLLSNLASHLKAKIDSGVVSCHDAYVSTLASLSKLDLVDAEAAKVRSRIRWAEDGESSTSSVLRLEKKHGAEGWFSALKDDDDNMVSDLNGIAWLSFYSNLFSAEPIDVEVQSEMLSFLSHSVPQSDVAKCEGLFDPDEVFRALNGMAKGKTPGSDGLPVVASSLRAYHGSFSMQSLCSS